jgi:hypothetical protein
MMSLWCRSCTEGSRRMLSHKPVHQLHVVGAEGGRVRADVKDLDLAAGIDDIEVELALGLGQRLPCLAHVEGLILGGHGTGESGDD